MTGELYVTCPRCRGRRDIFVITSPGNDFRASMGEHLPCPLCYQTGEADASSAAKWVAELEERGA